MVFPVNSIVFLVCTWLNIALVIGLGYLVVKFLISGIRFFNSQGKNKEERKNIRCSLGQLLKDYRLKNDMTQEFVARKLGVSRQAVSKWENGTSDPSTSNLIAIAKLYNVPAEEILAQVEI